MTILNTRKYQAVPGFFAQDHDGDPNRIVPAVPAGFGLLDTSPERWANFRNRIKELNENAAAGTSYKVIFFLRHGQGFHNVAEAKYGTIAWDKHWSKLNGDGELVWGPDPKLTSIGEGQAFELKEAWKQELSFGLPLPDNLYCSPLTRALRTCEIAFDGVVEYGPGTSRTVFVIENCREENGEHTCDKRNSRTHITTTFPRFTIEDTFTEEDELWDVNRETKASVAQRARTVLDNIFEKDASGTYISITAHGGIINGFLVSIGRNPYLLPTGGILPVVVSCLNSI